MNSLQRLSDFREDLFSSGTKDRRNFMMIRTAGTILLLSLLLVWFAPTYGENCFQGAEGNCTADNSCEVGGEYYCCDEGFVVRAISANDELLSCTCNEQSGSNTGFRCVVRSDQENMATHVTSASWLTCAVTLLVGLLALRRE